MANTAITTNTLIKGYHQSYQRYKVAKNQSDPEELFFSLFETLNWAVSVDEKLKKEKTNWQHSFGKKGEIMRAIRYVRNRVHHQWADAMFKSSGAAFPLELPFALMEWNWKKLEDLPPIEPLFKDEKGKQMYKEYLEGEPIRFSLGKLDNFFSQIANGREVIDR